MYSSLSKWGNKVRCWTDCQVVPQGCPPAGQAEGCLVSCFHSSHLQTAGTQPKSPSVRKPCFFWRRRYGFPEYLSPPFWCPQLTSWGRFPVLSSTIVGHGDGHLSSVLLRWAGATAELLHKCPSLHSELLQVCLSLRVISCCCISPFTGLCPELLAWRLFGEILVCFYTALC